MDSGSNVFDSVTGVTNADAAVNLHHTDLLTVMHVKEKPMPKKNATATAIRREDRAGHLDPKYAASLLARAAEHRVRDDNRAFITEGSTHDDLAEELGEEAVRAMTSGEDDIASHRDASVDEERGGPFVDSTGGQEFADGTDDSNPPEALREPFPMV